MWTADSQLLARRPYTRWLQAIWVIWSLWWLCVDQCSYLTSCVKLAGISVAGEAREAASLMALLSGYPLSDFAAGIVDYLVGLRGLDSLRSGMATALTDAVYFLALAVSGYCQWFVVVPKLLIQLRRWFKSNRSTGKRG